MNNSVAVFPTMYDAHELLRELQSGNETPRDFRRVETEAIGDLSVVLSFASLEQVDQVVIVFALGNLVGTVRVASDADAHLVDTATGFAERARERLCAAAAGSM